MFQSANSPPSTRPASRSRKRNERKKETHPRSCMSLEMARFSTIASKESCRGYSLLHKKCTCTYYINDENTQTQPKPIQRRNLSSFSLQNFRTAACPCVGSANQRLQSLLCRSSVWIERDALATAFVY